MFIFYTVNPVSTHSRPKAAANHFHDTRRFHAVSTHSRPKAAEAEAELKAQEAEVSTHSRPKAAAIQPYGDGTTSRFQHTAARRRLLLNLLSRVQPS